jgi:ribosome biogenesis GTPase A
MATIQWYPGHMAKAKREVQERLKLVDIVFEIVDARLPWSSRNPVLDQLIQDKPRLLILNKADLADPNQTQQWLKYARTTLNIPALAIDSQHQQNAKQIEQLAQQVLADKIARQREKGIQNKAIKAICIGIPNSGKSTILNRLVKRNVAITGNHPGVTKKQQWLKAGQQLALLDTPGILWPKFEDPIIGKKLALTGAIKDSLYHADDVALYALEFFKQYFPDRLVQRYHVTTADLDQPLPDLLLQITQKLGFRDDYDRASERIIIDCRKGKLGRFTLDHVQEVANDTPDD